MPRRSEIPDPPKMDIARPMKAAVAFAEKAGDVPLDGPAPVTALRLGTRAAEFIGDPKTAGAIARTLTSFIGDRKVDGRFLFRIGLFVVWNADSYLNGEDVDAKIASCLKEGHWTALEVSSVISAGYTKKGRHMWDVSYVHLCGPLAGRDYFMKGSDAYLCSIVRDISGARWSKTVAPVDLSLMRFKAFVEGETIRRIDTLWSTGKKHNSNIRKHREGCPNAPCEKCGKSRLHCPCSPYPVKEEV